MLINVEVGDFFFCIPVKACINDCIEVTIELVIIDSCRSLRYLLVVVNILLQIKVILVVLIVVLYKLVETVVMISFRTTWMIPWSVSELWSGIPLRNRQRSSRRFSAVKPERMLMSPVVRR